MKLGKKGLKLQLGGSGFSLMTGIRQQLMKLISLKNKADEWLLMKCWIEGLLK